MVQRSGRFKTAHTGWYLSAKAYGAVRRFETALYGGLFRGQSKKRHLHARLKVNFKEVKCYDISIFYSLLCRYMERKGIVVCHNGMERKRYGCSEAAASGTNV